MTKTNKLKVLISFESFLHNSNKNDRLFYFTFRVFAIDVSDGSVRAVITINNATNCDWEDIAVGVGPGGLWHIFIGDIGGNAGNSH